MHIVEMLFYWARTVPHRAAIIQSEMVTSFQGLADGIESIGERIDRLNLNKHEPIAVCLANPSLMLATVFALLRAGYTVAPVNAPLYPHLAGAGIRNLIYDTAGLVTSGGRNIRFDKSWLPGEQQPVTRAYRKRPIEDSSLIFFTSGTTGLPKKVIEPAAVLDWRMKYTTDVTEIHQKVLIIPGLTSTFGFYRVCEVLNRGKTACFAPGNMAALSLINLFGVEVVVASVVQALGLAETRVNNPGYRVDSLKAIFVGGGKIDPDGLARIRSALCRNVINTYGMTEAGVVGRTPFDVLTDISGAIAFPWVELEIVDEADRQLPTGREGLVRVRTPQLSEILNRSGPDKIPGVRDSWFYPGDIGSLDDQGVLHLSGRSPNVVNRGGVKVSAALIEKILKEIPEIGDAAACGVAGVTSGHEEIWIAIVPKGSIDVEQIKTRLREHNDIQLAPDEVFVVDELPRGDLGKVQKYRLTEMLLSRKRDG